VESWRNVWPVETIFRVMRVSPRGYHSWRTRPVCERARTDMTVLAHIREQYSLSLGSYGRPRMTMEPKEAGLAIGERRVGRLMRANGIKQVRTRRQKVTTDSHHRLGVAANRLDGDLVAASPNRKWAGDITYFWTSEGWLYLAAILDLYSRRVVGWAVSDRMKRYLPIRALDMAVRLRNPPPGCLFQSDRGSQYCSYAYQQKLQAHRLRPSMSGKGNCYDNASVETFFKSLTAELIWRQKWPARRQAEAAIFQYINGF
jgi:transposase InsO family protein